MEEVNQIIEKITRATTAYYSGKGDVVTDAQFDYLIDRLRTLDPKNPILKVTGWGFSEDAGKVKHLGANPVGSLDKYTYPSEVPAGEYLVMPKYDGQSVVITSVNGDVSAVTRGDGFFGKYVTPHVMEILSRKAPKLLNTLLTYKGIVSIRGEVMVDYASMDYFNSIGVKSSRLRNWSAGLLNRNEKSPDLAHLRFMPYFVRLETGAEYRDRKEMMDWLEDITNGEVDLRYLVVDNPTTNQLKEYIEEWSKYFLIDGLVLAPMDSYRGVEDDFTVFESNAFAYKVPSDAVDVIVSGIDWQIGSRGRVTPVVRFSPVDIGGVMVSRVTGHNLAYMQDYSVDAGAQIQVRRAGEVIPYIEAVITPAISVAYPSTCPACGGALAKDGAYLTCFSRTCGSRERGVIDRFLEAVVGLPRGLAATTITAWLELSNITTIGGLLKLFNHQLVSSDSIVGRPPFLALLQRHGLHFGQLLRTLERKIEAKLLEGLTFQEFWYIMSLDGLGQENAEKMASIAPPPHKTLAEIKDALFEIPGIPYTIIEDIEANLDFITEAAQMIRFKEMAAKDVKLIVGVTGDVSMPRDKWVKKMQAYGVKVGGLTKKCKYLISNSASNSSKTQKAKQYGIEIITEKQLYEILQSDFKIIVNG